MKNWRLGKLNWGEFHRCLEERTKVKSLALKSNGEVRPVLEKLGALFWIYGHMLERDMEDHFNARRRNAGVLLTEGQKVIDAADNLIQEEAWIETRFQICGTGRLSAKDVTANSLEYVTKLQTLIDLLAELAEPLRHVTGKRKPRVDDDENLFLYLMAAYCNLELKISGAPMHREIATLVNAWGDSLDSGVDDLDEHEIGRRIDRFRDRNAEAAADIDLNPYKFILHFLNDASRAGLRQGHKQAV